MWGQVGLTGVWCATGAPRSERPVPGLCSAVTVSKFLVILPSNSCFVNEVRWDSRACAGAEICTDTLLGALPSSSHRAAPAHPVWVELTCRVSASVSVAEARGTDSPQRPHSASEPELLHTERRQWCSRKHQWPRKSITFLTHPCVSQPLLAKMMTWKERKRWRNRGPFSFLISKPKTESVNKMCVYQELKLKQLS